MGSQCILRHQLFGNLASETKLHATSGINPGKLLLLEGWVF